MARTQSGLRAILSPAARRDIKDILLWSEEKFGKAAALRYEALLIQALRDIEAEPKRPGTSQRVDLPQGIRLYHLAFSRDRMKGDPVKEPRHFLVFRMRTARLEVLRILHESRDLARHLPEEGV